MKKIKNIVTIDIDEILKSSDRCLFKDSSVIRPENGTLSGNSSILLTVENIIVKVDLK
jgi:hypothetical protein